MTDDAPIPAATVLILRDEARLEVLMIERHAASAFAGGALVFPGGRIDAGDHDAAWADHAEGLDPDIGPAQVAAIREAFEESGVVIARGANGRMLGREDARALWPMRGRVEADDARFLDLIRAERLSLACDRLYLFAHWVAPPGLHRRFDTLFFATRLPDGQEAEVDGGEATEAAWIAPAEALAARAACARKIIFPTARNLDLLALSENAKEVFESARARRIEPIEPVVETRDGRAFIAIPEGLGYPVTSEELDPALRS